MDIVPPSETANLPRGNPGTACGERQKAGAGRSIRNAYTATFMTEDAARAFARRYKLDEDAVAGILVASRGNHKVICDFMTRLRSEKSKKGGIDLLQRISAKDLRDVRLEVLIDHMLSNVRTSAEYFRKYVRNPRVSNEMLTPYKAFFRKVVSKERCGGLCSATDEAGGVGSREHPCG